MKRVGRLAGAFLRGQDGLARYEYLAGGALMAFTAALCLQVLLPELSATTTRAAEFYAFMLHP